MRLLSLPIIVGALLVGLGGCGAGGSVRGEDGIPAASRAIARLPMRVNDWRPRGYRQALLGRVSLSDGSTFRFAVLRGGPVPRSIPGVPWYAKELESARREASRLGSTPYVFISDAGKDAATRQERNAELDATYAIEDALCLQVEHHRCPPI